MSSFDDREKTFEKKAVLEEELEFRSRARRNRLLGQWAAEKIGLSGDEAEAYVGAVIKADLEEEGDEDVFRKVRADFDANGVDLSDHQLRREMNDLLDAAREQVRTE